jgi:hypothetical protein
MTVPENRCGGAAEGDGAVELNPNSLDQIQIPVVDMVDAEVADGTAVGQDSPSNTDTIDVGKDEYQLKAVVKDQRTQPVLSAAYCTIRTAPDCSNLLMVLTSNSLTVYDDFHMGDHVAVVAQYVHEDAEEETTLVSAAWMPGSLESELHKNSPRILLALSNGSLAVVDIIESRITQLFKLDGSVGDSFAHASGRVLVAAPEVWADGKEYVCVLVGDQIATVWDLKKEEEIFAIPKSVSAVAYVGGKLLAARVGGGVDWYDMGGKESGSLCEGQDINSILSVQGKNCVLRSPKGFHLWDTEADALVSSWKLKDRRSQTEVTFAANAGIAVLGTGEGDGVVFDVESGDEICGLSIVRVSSEVEAVAVSGDGRHVILAAGSGFLFRFLKA